MAKAGPLNISGPMVHRHFRRRVVLHNASKRGLTDRNATVKPWRRIAAAVAIVNTLDRLDT